MPTDDKDRNTTSQNEEFQTDIGQIVNKNIKTNKTFYGKKFFPNVKHLMKISDKTVQYHLG